MKKTEKTSAKSQAELKRLAQESVELHRRHLEIDPTATAEIELQMSELDLEIMKRRRRAKPTKDLTERRQELMHRLDAAKEVERKHTEQEIQGVELQRRTTKFAQTLLEGLEKVKRAGMHIRKVQAARSAAVDQLQQKLSVGKREDLASQLGVTSTAIRAAIRGDDTHGGRAAKAKLLSEFKKHFVDSGAWE